MFVHARCAVWAVAKHPNPGPDTPQGVGNYVTDNPSHLGNYVTADNKWDGSADWYDCGEHVARGATNFTEGSVQPPLTEIDVLTSTGDIAYLGNC